MTKDDEIKLTHEFVHMNATSHLYGPSNRFLYSISGAFVWRRLMQERVEMARMAEDVARKTAEMAVRELAQARLGIQTIVEEPEDYDQE